MTSPESPRVLLFTDSDSYVKWGAALAGRAPSSWRTRLVVARGTAEPSARQLGEALAGSPFGPADVEFVTLERIRSILVEWRPDVVIAGARGLAVQALVELAIPDGPDRPVIVSGLPGIAVPVLPYGLGFRRGVDLFVLHSRREVRDFTAAAASLGFRHRFGLARLPFLRTDPAEASAPRDRIVFAAQAMVPESRAQRVRLLEQLVATAHAWPRRTVVVKVRGLADETQTHAEQHPYPALLEELRDAGLDVPPNLVVESGPMADHLDRAAGLVTVSSTAILEAVAHGVPCLALDDFGVDARQINLVFHGSGLLRPSSELLAGRFRHPDDAWLDDNYFHPPHTDTWVEDVEDLLRHRAAEGLPAIERAPDTLVGRISMVFYRHQAFVEEKSSWHALVERAVIAIALRVARSRWVVQRRFRPAPTAIGRTVDSDVSTVG